MKPVAIAAWRFVVGLRGPSKTANARRIRERGETARSLVVREATPEDIPALAHLHVVTWNATYGGLLMKGPSVEIRAHQWREAFAANDGSWFCYVIGGRKGDLVGFAKGVRGDGPAMSGELSKIYLLREYQRMGLGRRLVGHVTRRFLGQGVPTMSLYVDPRNPSCGFYEALGGTNTIEPDGKVNYSWYRWQDLHTLASICPID